MPASDRDRADEAAPAWRRALWIGLGTLLALLLAVAGRVASFDAYWIFRESPPWLAETGGANRLLDRQTRRAKVLQALSREYGVALVGSSTVYHGLDPADVAPAFRGRVFNAGISALSGAELPTVAAVVASRGAVGRVVVALDYYMFSRTGGPEPVDPALRGFVGRANARLGSLVGYDAAHDAWFSEVAGAEDPGRWTREGFRITPPLPPDLTRANDATRRRTTGAYHPSRRADLEATLARLAGREVQVYLSPVSAAQRRVMADLDLLDDFAAWRTDMARVAAMAGAAFLDLADLGRDDPFDPARGSTATWLDNLHYTPVLGREVLRALGLREPASAALTR